MLITKRAEVLCSEHGSIFYFNASKDCCVHILKNIPLPSFADIPAASFLNNQDYYNGRQRNQRMQRLIATSSHHYSQLTFLPEKTNYIRLYHRCCFLPWSISLSFGLMILYCNPFHSSWVEKATLSAFVACRFLFFLFDSSHSKVLRFVLCIFLRSKF